MIISTDTEKTFNKIQCPFEKKKQNSKIRNKSRLLNLIKDIYLNPTPNIPNDDRLNLFTLKLRIRQGCSLVPLLFNIVIQSLVFIQKWQDNQVAPKNLQKKLLEIIIEFSIVTWHKDTWYICVDIHIQKSIIFLYTAVNNLERKFLKVLFTIPFLKRDKFSKIYSRPYTEKHEILLRKRTK